MGHAHAVGITLSFFRSSFNELTAASFGPILGYLKIAVAWFLTCMLDQRPNEQPTKWYLSCIVAISSGLSSMIALSITFPLQTIVTKCQIYSIKNPDREN